MPLPVPPLTRIVAWAHSLVGDCLTAGDLAVDLTAGCGRDTLFLWQQVAPSGRVLSFDIQTAALAETVARLESAGAPVHSSRKLGEPAGPEPGVYPVAACHSRFGEFLPAAPQVIFANLGFHPGGNRELVTRPETTLAALQGAERHLLPGGRLLVAGYPGHPGGGEEAAVVEGWFAALPPQHWETLQLRVPNRVHAPFLVLAARRGGGAA
ncbi:class I SAM-dependent methyltransferase [Desulfuromonas carbonis]|uniref:tRNA (mnm(5)s(2)U34)-methyltransferase n=1 Tax=Desulfuromonas sp. DDH964 TaxID=1823759 RepID=UPI00078E2FFA|nr:class I SAM-dependent methyltransferase [Desulfuromonas sp. DDH964]AMV72818.1 rRNA methyltransferase [Desulfuromonas sp. DDH964]